LTVVGAAEAAAAMVVVGIATAASTDAKASKSERGRVRRISFIVFM
jgi:hypothetical protein